MNITIIGPGAVGVSLASSLAKNNTVSLIVKQQHNNLVKKGKISVKEISGKIIDKETKQPISGANVYLSDTMVGTSADENGNYSFSTNFNGTFLLVATFVGYRTKKRIIEISYDSVLIENFEMNASISKLDEIVVTASNKEWRRNYDLFKKFFLGDDEFAQQAFIENPESIYFKRSNDKKTISVYSEERIL